MNALEGAGQVIALAQKALPLIAKLSVSAKRLIAGWPWRHRQAYENLLLDLTLDLQDRKGHRAVITRKQRVRFLADDVGIVNYPIWGEGNQLKRYSTRGARRLGSRHDGSREVLLLGLDRTPAKESVAEILARQSLHDAFLQGQEYFEASVERPTKRLRLTVLFPKNRPPRDAYLSISPTRVHKALSVRYGADGRARIGWSQNRPTRNALFSLRWSW